jgi:hypothetical protein
MMNGDSLRAGPGDARDGLAHTGLNSKEMMAQEIRSWAKWLLGFGLFNIVLSGFSSGFGVLLLIVGFASLNIHVAAMFVVIAMTLAWAAVSNLLGLFWGDTSGIIWALIQVSLAYRTVRQYVDYRNWERESMPAAATANAGDQPKMASIFPLGGCLLSLLSVTGFIPLLLLAGMMSEISGTEEPSSLLIFAYDLLVNMAVLGIAMGLASYLSAYRTRPLAIMGVIGGTLILIANFIFALSG